MTFASVVGRYRIPRFIYIILFILLSLCIIFAIRDWRRNVVTHVVNGNTFILRDGRQIRLLSVDAPEPGRCMADRAKARLEQLVLGKYVRLKDETHDSYGQILANVIADESLPMWGKYLLHRFIIKDGYHGLAMVNRVILEEGLGKYWFSGTQYSRVLIRAHEVATTGKLGVYSSVCREVETVYHQK